MSDSINLNISNLKAFNRRLQKKLDTNKVKEYVSRGTLMVENTAKKSIQAGGTGIESKKYNPTRTHRASAPNNPPATDTGFLVSQITMNVDVKPNGTVVGQIISAAPYSKALEFGTTNMQPRPFMQPALMKNKRKIQAMFKKGILK
jgi:HK97 gp10 family phage protein